jgi:hypothetical protein
MIDQVRDIAEFLAPRLFGKSYEQLDFGTDHRKLETSELFQCCAEAARVRLEAIAVARSQGREYESLSGKDLISLSAGILARPGRIEEQRKILKQKGFLK